MVLRWKAAPGVSGYQVQIAKETAFSQIVLDERVKDPVLKWESLPSTTFYWRVRSFDSEGRASEWSAPRQIAPATGPPVLKSPEDGAVVTCAPEPITFTLETSSVLKEYQVEVSPDGRFAPGDTMVLKAATPELRGPLPLGTVSWRAKGIDLTGRDTEASPPRKLVVRIAAPKPKPTTDVPAGTASVTLAWAASPCARRYVVEASHDGAEKAVIEAADVSTSFKPAGLGEYRFRVAARDDKGNQSEWSAESSFRVRMPGPVGKGEAVGATGPNGAEVELSWTAPAEAAGYLVEVARNDAFVQPLTFNTHALNHKAVLAPGRYLWRVSARDATGHFTFPSEPRGFVVGEVAPPAKVTLLFPVDQAILVRPADGLLGVTWSKAANAVTHELEVDGLVQAVGTPPIRLTLTDGDHTLRIRAIGATQKASEWSLPVRFFFGTPQVVSAEVAFGRAPLRADGATTTRVRMRLLDPRGRVVAGAKPALKVDRGVLLGGPTADGDGWVAQWQAPAELPADRTARLTVTAGRYTGEHALKLAPDFAPLSLAASLGGRFNFGAVKSPAGAVSLAWRPYLLDGLLGGHLKVGVYQAGASLQGPDGPVAAQVVVPSITALVGAHFGFGKWTVLGVVGGGAQLAITSVGAATQTAALPAFEVAVVGGRRLGPGAIELEVSFLYARLDIPLARLQAGGLFLGIGYRFDLSGGS